MYRKSNKAMKLEGKRQRRANQRAARARKRLAEAASWRDVGGFVTDGILGVHSVRLLANNSEEYLNGITVDGNNKTPRTPGGVRRCIVKMICGKVKLKQNLSEL